MWRKSWNSCPSWLDYRLQSHVLVIKKPLTISYLCEWYYYLPYFFQKFGPSNYSAPLAESSQITSKIQQGDSQKFQISTSISTYFRQFARTCKFLLEFGRKRERWQQSMVICQTTSHPSVGNSPTFSLQHSRVKGQRNFLVFFGNFSLQTCHIAQPGQKVWWGGHEVDCSLLHKCPSPPYPWCYNHRWKQQAKRCLPLMYPSANARYHWIREAEFWGSC